MFARSARKEKKKVYLGSYQRILLLYAKSVQAEQEMSSGCLHEECPDSSATQAVTLTDLGKDVLVCILRFLRSRRDLFTINTTWKECATKAFDPSVRYDWALRWASKWNRVEIVSRLLRDVRVNPAGNLLTSSLFKSVAKDNQAIKLACECGHLKVVQLLLQVIVLPAVL